ncbi:MAG: hypothetical protein AMJ92_08055 [candidate division Zixibacteria bacterium SM23_81]|nr:MAG: hypothetical protein AMJ92_08055 [candidate division Zixibacteria bacterium SM23_81]
MTSGTKIRRVDKKRSVNANFVFSTLSTVGLVSLILLLGFTGCGKKEEKQKAQATIQIESETPEAKPGEITATISVKPDKRRSLAIMYFENRSGDSTLDWMSKGIAEMLITDLSQSHSLDVLSGQELYNILQEMGQDNLPFIIEETAIEVALKAGIETILLGSFTKTGETVRISARLLDGFYSNLIKAETVEGFELESIFTMVDQLSRAIRDDLNLSMAEDEADLDIMDLTTNSIEAYEAFAKGLEELHKRKFKDGMVHFEQAVEIDSNFTFAYAVMASYWHNIGNISRAKDAAIRAIALLDRLPEPERRAAERNSTFALARAVMTIYWHGIGDEPRTRDATSHAMVLLGRLPEPEKLMILAIDAHLRGDYDEGFRLYRSLWELLPEEKRPAYYSGLGQLYFSRGEFEEAKQIYKNMLRFDPILAPAHYMLGLVHHHQGTLDSTEMELQEALRLSPDIIGAHLILAQIYSVQGRVDEAEFHRQQVVKLDPENPQIYSSLGYQYLYQKRYDKAIAAFKQYVTLAPNDPNSHVCLGEGYFREGDSKRAEKECLQAIKLDSSFANPYFTLALIYEQRGQAKKAIESLKKYLRLSPEGLMAKVAQLRLEALQRK